MACHPRAAGHDIYRKASPVAPWEHIVGKLVQVDCAGAALVVGVNASHDIYKCVGRLPQLATGNA